MVAQPSYSQWMSIEEWRALEEKSHDAKYEYIDGQVYLMSGGDLPHSLIAVNTISFLRAALRGKPCKVYNSDAAVRVSETRYTYPDATITCDPLDRPVRGKREIKGPRIIFEVLSPSTYLYDRGSKFKYYCQCPSLEEYVLIRTDYQRVEVRRREPQFWLGSDAYEVGKVVELKSIRVRIPVADIYEDSSIPETQ